MPKTNSKLAAPVEVIEDSEEEQPKRSKKVDSASDAKKSDGDEGDGDDEEYEIEAILDAKHGHFAGGRTGYLVKWKGYSEEHNSWVDENDAGGAGEMIEEYWEKARKDRKGKPKTKQRPRKSDTKTTSPDADEPVSPSKRKKGVSGRKSKSTPEDEPMDEDDEEEEKPRPKKKTKKTQKEKGEEKDVDMVANEEREDDYLPMDKNKHREKSWENLVRQVDTIEKGDGVLKVFFTLNNGEKVVESSRECAKYFPQKLIEFYESNLRWRET